jgi:hypothetical protein
MALETEVVPLARKKFRVLRSMRVMAGETLAIFERLVLDCSALFQARGIMAVGAELGPFLGRQERFLRFCPLVAALALAAGDRVVSACLQELGLHGRVRIMASDARCAFHRIVSMSFLELRPSFVVAVEAKRGLPFRQKVLLIRAVGYVTGIASLGGSGVMDNFLFVVFLLMTPIAGRAPLFLQQVTPL